MKYFISVHDLERNHNVFRYKDLNMFEPIPSKKGYVSLWDRNRIEWVYLEILNKHEKKHGYIINSAKPINGFLESFIDPYEKQKTT